MKTFVLDASSIISLSDSCLLYLLKDLHDKLDIELVIPRSVEDESVTRPLNIKRFELNAIRIKKGIEEGWLKVRDIGDSAIKLRDELESVINSIFFVEDKDLTIFQRGESEAIVLAAELNSEVFVIDERTTRALLEDPLSLHSLIQRRQGRQIQVRKEGLNKLKDLFPDVLVVRSCDLIAWAFEQKAFSRELLHEKAALEAALYAVKFKGCAVSIEEIKEYLRSVK